MVRLKFSQLGCDTHRVPGVFKSGQNHGVLRLMRGSVTLSITRPDGVQLVKHTDIFTHYINASLKATSIWKETALPSLCYCSPPPHYTAKIFVFTCRGYLAPNKSTLGTSMLLNYMSFVTRKGLIWSWHLWQASQLLHWSYSCPIYRVVAVWGAETSW
jgi:hypothetical protein